MHDQINQELRATKPDQHMQREQLYLQHLLMDKIVDTLRRKGGK